MRGEPSTTPAPVPPGGYVDALARTVPRSRGPKTMRQPSREHEFRTPALPTPRLERPTGWAETARSHEEMLAAVDVLEAAASGKERARRRAGVAKLLDWLSRFDGETWQQRWIASPLDAAGAAWTDHVDVPGLRTQEDRRGQLTGAVGRLLLLGALRPNYRWLYQVHSSSIVQRYRDLHDPAGFAALDRLCQATSGLTIGDRQVAFHQLTRILIHNGGRLADINVEDCVEAYRAQTGYTTRQHSHWYVLLRDAAILPVGAPPTVQAAARRGQLTVEELVDGYGVSCLPVRDLLVDYLHERQPGMDYTSLRQLSSKLALLFWRDLELHEPGIDSLHLPDAVARGWKQRLTQVRYGTNRVGQRREDLHAILLAVRAFYADLTHWALEDPARWGPWAAPSPVSSRDLAGLGKQRTRARSRMHQRTRELTPMLPTLVAAAQDRRRQAAAALAAARAVQPGQEFGADGKRLRRTELATDPERGGSGRPGVIYAVNIDGSGPRRNLTLAEDDAFWTWAIVETLRHTGVRIEEMLELTHRSFAAYTLPTTGEVIPLLQITPSKTDRERLLVVSPELAEVLTTIIARVRGTNAQLPRTSRYDQAERLHSPPLPFLFQRRWGLRQQTLTNLRVKDLLDRLVTVAAINAADGSPLRFTPHDFRRIFATDAVASGLPVHIAAKLLGHQTLSTTQAYIAVYDRDVIDHHRAFLARRRALRPSEEYREPTDAEWDEFLGHFEKRKVELGVCGRAYGTACQHEHACVRCPMLRPDPAQLLRLEEIVTNLHARLAEARSNGWLGEVDGLQTTIHAADDKLATMRRTASGTVALGMPAVPTSTHQHD